MTFLKSFSASRFLVRRGLLVSPLAPSQLHEILKVQEDKPYNKEWLVSHEDEAYFFTSNVSGEDRKNKQEILIFSEVVDVFTLKENGWDPRGSTMININVENVMSPPKKIQNYATKLIFYIKI